MKVYVAAKYEAKDLTRTWYERLRAAGFTITHDWTNEDDAKAPAGGLDDYHRKCAEADVQGVVDADALLLIPHKNGQGMFVEMGIAIARNIPIVVLYDINIGTNRNDGFRPGVFFDLPNVRTVVNDVAALGALTKIALHEKRPVIVPSSASA